MKKHKLATILLMACGAMSAASYAVDVQKVAPPATPTAPAEGAGMQHGMGGGMGMHHGMGGMGGMMMNMSDEEKDKHMRGMQEHMLKMHDLSNRILAEKDPAKKENLMKEQLDLMKAHHAEHHAKMMQHHKDMKDMQHKPMK